MRHAYKAIGYNSHNPGLPLNVFLPSSFYLNCELLQMVDFVLHKTLLSAVHTHTHLAFIVFRFLCRAHTVAVASLSYTVFV